MSEQAERRVHITVEWGEHSDVPEGVIHATIGHAIEHLLGQFDSMGVTDSDLSVQGLDWELAGLNAGIDPGVITRDLR